MTSKEIIASAINSIRANKISEIERRKSEIINDEVNPKIKDNEKRFEERYAQEKTRLEQQQQKERENFESSWAVAKAKLEENNQSLISEGNQRAEFEIGAQFDNMIESLEKLIAG